MLYLRCALVKSQWLRAVNYFRKKLHRKFLTNFLTYLSIFWMQVSFDVICQYTENVSEKIPVAVVSKFSVNTGYSCLNLRLFSQKLSQSFQMFAFYHFLSILSKHFNTKMFQNINRKHSLFTYCHYEILKWFYRNLKTNPSQSGEFSRYIQQCPDNDILSFQGKLEW